MVKTSLRTFFKLFLVLALAGSLWTSASAQDSPVGGWHFTITGSQKGLASLTFFDGGLVEGFIFVTPVLKTNNVEVSQVFGFGNVTGAWSFDDKGRVLFTFDVGAEDNNFAGSAVGKVKNGKFNAVANSPQNGRFKLQGVPEAFVADLTGSWNSFVETANGFTIENFELPSLGVEGLFGGENVGIGPDYTITVARVFLAANGRMAIFFEMVLNTDIDPEDEDPPSRIRLVTGKFNTKTFRATLTGIQEDTLEASKLVERVRMKITPAGL